MQQRYISIFGETVTGAGGKQGSMHYLTERTGEVAFKDVAMT